METRAHRHPLLQQLVQLFLFDLITKQKLRHFLDTVVLETKQDSSFQDLITEGNTQIQTIQMKVKHPIINISNNRLMQFRRILKIQLPISYPLNSNQVKELHQKCSRIAITNPKSGTEKLERRIGDKGFKSERGDDIRKP